MQVENIKQLLSVLYYSSNYKGVIELGNIIESEYKLFYNEEIQFITLTYQLMSYYALNDFQQVLLIYKKIENLQSVSNKPEHQMVFKLFSYLTKYVGNDLEKIEERLLEGFQISWQLKAEDMTYTYLFLNNFALILKDQAKYSEMESLLTVLIEMMRINESVPFLLMLRAKLNLLEAFLYNNKKRSYERLRNEIELTIFNHHNHFIGESSYYKLIKLKYEILFNPKNYVDITLQLKEFDLYIEKVGLLELRLDLYQFILQNGDLIKDLDINVYKMKLETLMEEIMLFQQN